PEPSEPEPSEPEPSEPEPSEPEPSEPTPESSSVDPFEGISDDDIRTFSELFDVPSPENDDEANKLGNKIREWIKNGKLEPGESKIEEETNDEIEDDEEEKPKKKRGMFGFGK
ncbi:MAG: signal recognition particle-docking protein FtsY, partial [Nitrosopumilus sp.]